MFEVLCLTRKWEIKVQNPSFQFEEAKPDGQFQSNKINDQAIFCKASYAL